MFGVSLNFQLYFITIVSFAAGMILFYYAFLEKLNQDDPKNDNKKREHKSEDVIVDFRECILALLAKVMNYDGKQTKEELERVKITIRRYYQTPEEQNNALNQFAKFLKDPNLTYGKYCDYINQKLDGTAKSEIIMELMAVAFADGEFLSSEEYIIHTIASKLYVPEFELKSIRSIFYRKYKEGSYNGSKSHYNSYKHLDTTFCILVLLAEVMKADGRQMSCELDCIKSFIRNNYKSEDEQKDALQKLKEILNKEYDLESICLNLKYQLDDQEKTNLIINLLDVIYADDINTDEEDNVLCKILDNLDISSKRYRNIIKKYQKKHNQKNSKSNKSKNNSQNNNQSYNKKESSNSNRDRDSNSNNNNGNNQKKSWMSGAEAYAILGMDVSATDEELKKAYRAMAIKYHPDRISNLGDEAIRQATETMKQINIAWEVLKEARRIK